VAASETVIANLALAHLGNKDAIGTLETDTSREAEVCRTFYDTARDELLRVFPWPFATKFAELTEVEEDPTDEWAYSYRYPSDCVYVRRIFSGERNDDKSSRIAYKIGADGSGRLIYCDQDDAELEYTFRNEDTTDYPDDFTMTLSYRLAAYMAPQLTQGDPFGLRDFCYKKYLEALMTATSGAYMEEQPDEPPESEFITGRD